MVSMKPESEHAVIRSGSPIPEAPGAYPLVGHAPYLARNPSPWLAACRRTGPVVRVRLGTRPAYLVCAPELVHRMLVIDVEAFDKGGPILDNARPFVGNGLVTSAHAEHRRQRRIMQSAFLPGRIDGYASVFQHEGDAMISSWTAGKEIDFLAEAHVLVARTLARTLLPEADLPESGWLADKVADFQAGLLIRTALPHPWVRRLPLPANRRFEQARNQLQSSARRAIAAARIRPTPGSLVDNLMTARDGDGDGFSDQELVDQIITLLLGGTEPIACTLAWAAHLLTQHPDVQRRLQEEMDSALDGRTAGPEDFRNLRLTRNVLQETLRLYPIVWMMTRASTQEVALGEHRFPAGTDFLFSAYQLQHDPAHFPQPERFDPDRWDTPVGASTRQAHIPFGQGRRKCIGDTFGMAEATIVLSAVLTRWHLRPAPNSRVRSRFRSDLSPSELRIIPHPRNPRT
ncbi:cytochrome P450 [Streptomyces axinellae]|uniref:Cytochrome P450 n=1 Tax=Streptomyces axinellae TaxID=552788 RepID=A0ABN3QAQ8_9ACTN